ncbi:MAG: hypothetical protein ACW97Z_15060 [Candidatus Hodarchaeales archaeon]
MKKRSSTTLITCIIMISVNLVLASPSDTNILIDGNLSDWDSIDPLFHENETKFDPHFDIKEGYLTVNDTNLFLRIDMEGSSYESTGHVFLYVNVTIQTLSEVFVLSMGADYYENQFYSNTWLTPGRNLNSPYHIDPRNDSFYVKSYQNTTALDPTNTSIEASYSLIDLGLEVFDEINITFWHFDNYSAATLYDVPLEYFSAEITPTANSYKLVFLTLIFGVIGKKMRKKELSE